ncbi:MAG TPA: hypothetical protein VFW76_05390, partial [Ktedonobacterales bacterium]|nr:hypothetical protein [Ktedonobacterales bacterium]
MTTHHGWQHTGGREPEDQRPRSPNSLQSPQPPYPWQNDHNNQDNNGWNQGQNAAADGASSAPNQADISHQPPYQPALNPQVSTLPPSPPAMNGGHPDQPYPLSAPATTNGPYGQRNSAAVPVPAPSAQAPASPAPAPLDDSDEENVGVSTTTKMARLSRNPEYREVERLLANRRRARARLSEMMLLVDAGLSVLLIVLIERFSGSIAHIIPQIHYLKTLDALIFAAIVVVVWPIVFSLLGLYRSSWVNNVFAPLRAFISVGLA